MLTGKKLRKGCSEEVTSRRLVKSHEKNKGGPKLAVSQWIRKKEAGSTGNPWISKMLYFFIHGIPSH